MLALPPCPADPEWGTLERRRRFWWHHAGRHRLVAKLARALAHADEEELRSSGLALTPEESRRAAKGWRAVVLVESRRHGAALLKLLPDWAFFDAAGAGGADAGKKDSGGRRDGSYASRAAGWIVTLTRAWRGNIKAGALVRVTGGCGRLLLHGDQPQGVEVAAHVRLVVDFFDQSDGTATCESYQRIEAYRKQRLEVVGAGADAF
jgi:hypothetical protein